MDIHHASDTSPNDDHDLIHRSRRLREHARRIAERAASARSCFDPPPKGHTAATTSTAQRISSAKDDRYVLVEVAGEIDILSRCQLSDELTRAADSGALW